VAPDAGLAVVDEDGFLAAAAARSRSWARESWRKAGGCGVPQRRWRWARTGKSPGVGTVAASNSTLTGMASRTTAAARLGGRTRRSMGGRGGDNVNFRRRLGHEKRKKRKRQEGAGEGAVRGAQRG